MLRIDARSSRELRAIIFALSNAEKAIQSQIRKQTRAAILPEWKQALAENADTRPEFRALVNTGRATVSNQNIKLTSATIGKKLSGGLNPKTDYPGLEFGSDRAKKSTYTARSKNGKAFTVTRRTRAQLRPRNPKGYVFYPAVANMVPRVAALWAQTTVRVLHEALEGKSNG